MMGISTGLKVPSSLCALRSVVVGFSRKQWGGSSPSSYHRLLATVVSDKLIWYKESISLLLLFYLLKNINVKIKPESVLEEEKWQSCITWATGTELGAFRGEAVVSLDSAIWSLSRPLDQQDFWLGRPLPWTTETTFNLSVRLLPQEIDLQPSVTKMLWWSEMKS